MTDTDLTSQEQVNKSVGMCRLHGLHNTEATLRALSAALEAEKEKSGKLAFNLGAMTNTPDTSPEAVERLNALHRQLCFENGDHPQEIDTPYSLGADALVRVRALSAAHAAALVRERDANAKAMQHLRRAEAADAERTALKAELARLRALMEARDAFERGEPSQPPETGVQKRAFPARHQKGTKP